MKADSRKGSLKRHMQALALVVMLWMCPVSVLWKQPAAAEQSGPAAGGPAPKVALTFDDGPSSVYTKILLDGLKERKVKATFFLVGENVENNKKLTKRISKEGHLIGNHTYSHADLARTNYNKASVEINKTNEIITSITGTSPKYIRPPYGDVNKKLLENTGMRVVLWNVDPEDWKDQNADIVVNRIISHVRPGDIILLHDIFKSSVEAALKTVDILQDKGYQFVTVDKLNNSTIK